MARCPFSLAAPIELLFDQAETEICDQGHQRRRHRAGEEQAVVVETQSAKNVFAQAAGADFRGDDRDADRNYHGDTHAGENDAHRERQFDLQQHLSIGHAHRHRSFAHGPVDAKNSRHRITNDWQQCVEDEGDNRDAWTNAANEWQWDQKTKKRETRDRLHHVSDAQHRRAQTSPAGYQNSYRQGDDDGNRDREKDQPEVLRDVRQDV